MDNTDHINQKPPIVSASFRATAEAASIKPQNNSPAQRTINRITELERRLQFAQDEFNMDWQIELEEGIARLEEKLAKQLADEDG